MEMIVQRLKSRIVGTRGDPGAWTLKILGQKVRETLGGQSRGKTRTKRRTTVKDQTGTETAEQSD